MDLLRYTLHSESFINVDSGILVLDCPTNHSHRLDMSPDCYDPAPIFHFPPPPQVTTTTPPPPVIQPARAQQAPVRCQSSANIPLPPSPPPMDICPPSPPRPTLAHLMPQSNVPNLADTYMQTSPSSPKAKYLWEAFKRAKEYASEARDRTPPPLPMEAELTSKSRRREARDSPAMPITPATCRHSPSPEAPRTRRNSEDSYDDHKDPSHPLYQYDYREAYRQHILQTSKDRACYGLFRSIVLSLLTQTYPRRVFNYLRIICTTGPFTARVYSHARTCKRLSDLSVI